MESYSRRNNLIFEGVLEAPNESIYQIMRQKISDMGLDVTEIKIIGCHRIGSNNGKSPRPIIVKFLTYDDRKSVWGVRGKTQRGVWVKEDYPTEIEKRRKILWPYLRAAYKGDPTNPKGRVSAYIRLDKLYVNNQCFTCDKVDLIPEYLKVNAAEAHSSTCIKQTDHVTIFFTKYSPLSNFHSSAFTVDNQVYKNAEQYVSHKKAILFGDKEIAREILTMTDPAQMKRRVSHLKGFKAETWSTNAPGILNEALIAKFKDNPDLRATLLSTNDTQIGEACTNDALFGIGLSLRDRSALDTENWTGANIQGIALMEIRQMIKDGLI